MLKNIAVIALGTALGGAILTAASMALVKPFTKWSLKTMERAFSES